jgi:hypothetical protein
MLCLLNGVFAHFSLVWGVCRLVRDQRNTPYDSRPFVDDAFIFVPSATLCKAFQFV